ncbi:MAG: Do family serine endopeptidase [Lentilitoribacter sp.]
MKSKAIHMSEILKVNAFAGFVLALLIVFASINIAKAQAPNGPTSVADLAEGLMGAVVNISTSQSVESSGQRNTPRNAPDGQPFQEFFDEFFQDREDGRRTPNQQVSSLGSGFVIDAEGTVVTNNHVIENADNIEVIFADGRRLDAVLVGADPKTDLAVLKVESDEPLAFVPVGDSTKMRIGDWVMAIGNPFGLGGSVSIGIVSAIGRDINSGPYDNYIQTDAAINRGNSGGPLFNMAGEVIGINTAIISPSGGSIGIGFSVPTELASNVINQLRDFGETRRGWLGVRIQPVTDDIAESLGMDEAKGALVAGVIPEGPVEGIMQAGDIIVKFDGKEVGTVRDLPRIVAESPVGKEVDVEILRKGEMQNIKVTLGRLEDGERKLAAANDDQPAVTEDDTPAVVELMGMELRELTDALRDEFAIDENTNGVLINAVDEGSNADKKDVQSGNVIVEVAQEAVKTPQDVQEVIEKLKSDGRRNAFFMIANQMGELRFVTIRIE